MSDILKKIREMKAAMRTVDTSWEEDKRKDRKRELKRREKKYGKGVNVALNFTLENGRIRKPVWIPLSTDNEVYIFIDSQSGLVASNEEDGPEGPKVLNEDFYSIIGMWDSERQETIQISDDCMSYIEAGEFMLT